MRSERFTRKTCLKKNSIKPDGDITIYDLTQPGDCGCEAIALSSFSAHDASLPDSFEYPADILEWCAALIGQSPTAFALLKDAARDGWSVGLSDLHSNGFHIDAENKKILLDHFSLSPTALGRSAWFRNTVLITFIRALRDIWHEGRRAPFESEYGPEDVLMLERVRMADCDTVTVFAAWELRGAGFADVWRHLIGSSDGDMALIFTRFLERDPTALFDGSALTYAFRQWYADAGRVDACDHGTLEAMDDLLLESEDRKPFGAKRLTGEALEQLAVLPDGTCYLSGLGETVRSDPFFAGLHDEINQTHLFHLIHDMDVTLVNNVPFRDRALARKLFPQGEALL